MSWVDAAAYAAAEPDPLADAAAGIIEHMNADHADAQVLFCRHFAGLPDTDVGDRCRRSTATASTWWPSAPSTGPRCASVPGGVHDRRRGAAGDGRDGGRGASGARLTGDGLPSPDLWLTDRTVIDWDSSSPHCS